MSEDQNTKPIFFTENKPAAIRLWHWLSVLFLLGSLASVLFASTLFRAKDNISLVMEQVNRKGGTITKDQAMSVAHEYSDKLWMLHKYIGYGLAILLFWRLVTEVKVSKEKKISTRIRAALAYHAGPEQNHYLLVQYGHLIFYSLFTLMALTGLILAFEDQQWLEPVHDTAKTVHSIIQYGLYAYLFVHVCGVIRADLTRYGGIVSRMINGKN